MFKLFLNSALLALQHDRFHTALNVTGLAVSLAAVLLIGLYVRHELSYENFFTNPGRVYRVEATYQNRGQPTITLAYSAAPATAAIREDFAGELQATALDVEKLSVSAGEVNLRASVAFADTELFNVLDFPVLAGNASDALRDPASAIIAQNLAQRLFASDDVIGRTLRVAGQEFRITAVLRQLPSNTHFSGLDVLVSRTAAISQTARWERSWGMAMGYTFVRVGENTRVGDLAARLGFMVQQRVPPGFSELSSLVLSLRALPDIHLSAGDGVTIDAQNRTALHILVATGVVLVLTACFNYVNLSTALALLRRREMGVRKVLGGSAVQLAGQLLTETVLTVLLAALLALLLVELTLPLFSIVMNREMTLAAFATPGGMAAITGLLLLVCIGSGAWPALHLASTDPRSLFRAVRHGAGARSLQRSVMVGLQFGATVGLLVATGVVNRQIDYLRDFDLGFEPEGLLMIENLPVRQEAARGRAYLDAVQNLAAVTAVSSAMTPLSPDYEDNTFLRRVDADERPLLGLQALQVGYGFFEMLELQPLAGRTFSPAFADEADLYGSTPSRVASIVLSASAVPYYGFASPEAALGEVLRGEWMGGTIEYSIVGVVPDFHVRLAQAQNKPAAFLLVPDNQHTAFVRMAPAQKEAAIGQAYALWRQIFPDRPFEYTLLESVIEQANEENVRRYGLFGIFAGLTMLVACIGLFGLASFVAARRMRELTIRRVLGASGAMQSRLLVWEFMRPVLIAILFAWPVAWFAMRRWLDGFAYRVELDPLLFFQATVWALGIAALTVAGRTVHVVSARPADLLKLSRDCS